MNTIDRYIAVRVGWGFLLATASLLAVFSVFDFLNEIEKAGTGRYDVAQAAQVFLLEIPSKAYDLFPAAALLGTVTALGVLAGSNEIVALWASGVSSARLCRPILQVGLVLVVLMLLLGELVAAPLVQRAETRRSIALSGGLALNTANGFWSRSDSRFVNIRSPVSGNELGDLYIYEFDEQHRMRTFTRARQASATADGWVLEDVIESRFGDDGITTRRRPSQSGYDLPGAEQLRLSSLRPEDLSFADLDRSIASLRQRGESARRHEAAFWSRISMPLSMLIMMFLAVPFVLTAPRGIKLGQRVAVAALSGIGFQMVAGTFVQLGLVYGLNPIVSALLPGALVLALASWALRVNSNAGRLLLPR